jgi:apolipoprotein N-acyltransferase
VLIFPGFEVHFLAWIALVPLFLVLKQSGPLKAFLFSFAAGVFFYSVAMGWMLRVSGVNPFNFALVTLWSAWHMGIFGLSSSYFQRKLPHWNVLTFPTTWVILEYLRAHMAFLSSPWGILGYSQYSFLPVARISAWTGVYGVSFVIVTVNTVLSEIMLYYLSRSRGTDSRWTSSRSSLKIPVSVLAGTLILFSASFLYGLSPVTEQGRSALNVALVQGNIHAQDHYDTKIIEKVFQKYQDLTLSATTSLPTLVAWPESAVPGRIPYDWKLVSMLSGIAQRTGAFLLTGTAKYDKFNTQKRLNRTSNSAFLFSPQGKIIGQYDKILLLPFSEYIPWRGHVQWPSWVASPDSADFEPGRALTIFKMDNIKFGVQICWENMLADQFREMAAKGIDFAVSMTSEAFTDIPAAHYQLLAMNVFRAIENHVSILRIASTGVSCVIDPNGRIVDRVKDQNRNDVNVEGYLTAQIPLTSKRSFYNRYGDLFIYIVFAAVTGLVLVNIIERKK